MLAPRQALQEHLARMSIKQYFSALEPTHVPRGKRKPFALHDLIRGLAVLPADRKKAGLFDRPRKHVSAAEALHFDLASFDAEAVEDLHHLPYRAVHVPELFLTVAAAGLLLAALWQQSVTDAADPQAAIVQDDRQAGAKDRYDKRRPVSTMHLARLKVDHRQMFSRPAHDSFL